MIEKHIKVLDDIRNGNINIDEFAYQEGTDSNGFLYDVNSLKRYRLLIAMQYSRKKSDEFFLKYLIDSELKMHRYAPFQGLYSSMNLNAYLLSQFNRPEYALIFLRVKQANFDTHCGFDLQYLLSAGIERTYDYINSLKNEDEDKLSFFELAGETKEECYFSEAEIEKWKACLDKLYPEEYKFEHIKEEIQLAIELEEYDILKEKVNQWSQSISTWTINQLHDASYYFKLLKDSHQQIWVNEQLVNHQNTEWDKASQLQTLAQLYNKHGFPIKAWEKINQAHQYMIQNQDWKQVGLGRFIIETTFEIIININNINDKTAVEAFELVSKEIRGVKNLHLSLLEKAVKAGQIMNNSKFVMEIEQILHEEQQIINQIFEQ